LLRRFTRKKSPPGSVLVMTYEVHLDVFDGPFSLLFQLISAQEVDLYEVRLADVVDAFVAEMVRAESLDLEVSTEFLLIAATLVELKCRRLLPVPEDYDDEDELALYEARDYLLARLVECRTFAQAAAELQQMEARAQRSMPRRLGADERFSDVVPDLLAGVSAERLRRIAARALAERPTPHIEDTHVLVDEVSVAETIEALIDTLREKKSASFRELTEHFASPAYVVASFLAILELYKRALVDLEQPTTFGTLTVTWIGGMGDAGGFSEDIDDYGAPAGVQR
jgi:segregation and condensation protein A